jgi:DNA-binding transcriptional MerR regulator
MRLAELSSRSGLSAPTIKYYLRLGLLAPGETESATWASYDDAHLRRLTLIRALTDVGGLSLDAVRDVLATVDDPASSRHEARGAAQWPLSPEPATEPAAASLAAVDDVLGRAGWELDPDSPHRRRLASQLDTLAELGFPATDQVLDAYVAALEPVAEIEVARIAGEEPTTAAEHVVIGTVLYEPVLLTLRRIAHEVVSGRG